MSADQIEGQEAKNFELFRDILSEILIEKLTVPAQRKPRRRERAKSKKEAAPPPPPLQMDTCMSTTSSAEKTTMIEEISPAADLADFTDYTASELFPRLPDELRTLAHHTWVDSPGLQSRFEDLPLTSASITNLLPNLVDPAVADSLAAYRILPSALPPLETLPALLAPLITAYLTALSTAPPPPSMTKDQFDACELCERDWVRLTYHHLIPRMVHDKAVKRGWRRVDELQNVAWLCRACHSAVHRVKGHEELAREWYTVERLREMEELKTFVAWVGKVKW